MTIAFRLAGNLLNAAHAVSPVLGGRLAFTLFWRPGRRGKVLAAERATHSRAEVSTLTVNGKRVMVYRWGDGTRPVLLMHGWKSRASRYGVLVDRLAGLGYSAVAFDAPGHGDSGGDGTTILEYEQIARQLDERFGAFEAIVAHSFGALCAAHAVRSGVRTRALVTVSAPAEFSHLVEEFARQLGLTQALADYLRRRMESMLDTADMWARFSVTYRPDAITAPILVIHDEQDRVVGVDHAHRIGRAYPSTARVVITKGLGHRRILGAPEIVEPITEFLTRPVGIAP